MVDSNEEINNKVNTEDTIDTNKVRKEDFVTEQELDAQSIEAKQINKMLLVEETVKKHPMFIAMQNATKGKNTNFMLKAVVENYFELTSENNILANREFYTVNDSIIYSALHGMAYLISAEENGIVLDENGEYDREASAEQQRQAVYSRALKNEIDAELQNGTVEYYKEILKSNDNTSKDSLNLPFDMVGSSFYREQAMAKTHMSLDYLFNQNFLIELSNDEKKSAVDNMFKDAATSRQETKRNLFIGSKAEFNVLLNAMLYTSALNNVQPPVDKMAGYLEEIAKNDKKGQFINPETGRIDSVNVVSAATMFHDAYRQKSNFKILQKFQNGKKTFEELKPDEQKQMLTSIWSLYRQPPSPERDCALGVMMQISAPSIQKGPNRDYIIDENRFLNLYNATIGKPISFEQMNRNIDRADLRLTTNFLQKIKKKIRDGTFQEFEFPEGISPEEAEKFKNEAIAQLAKAKKPKLNLSEEVRLNRALEGFIKKGNIEGTKPEIIIAAYHLMEKRNTNCEKEMGILKSFIENNTSTFGEYIYKGEITYDSLDIEYTERDKINQLVDDFIGYQKKRERIQENKFSKEAIEEQVNDVKQFVKSGIKYLGDRGKAAFNNLFKRQKQLPEAQIQHIDVTGELSELFAEANENKELPKNFSSKELKIMTKSEKKAEEEIKNGDIPEKTGIVNPINESEKNVLDSKGNQPEAAWNVNEEIKDKIRAVEKEAAEKRAAEINKNSEDAKAQEDSDFRDTADKETKDEEDYTI